MSLDTRTFRCGSIKVKHADDPIVLKGGGIFAIHLCHRVRTQLGCRRSLRIVEHLQIVKRRLPAARAYNTVNQSKIKYKFILKLFY